ncbi:hypothetical protein AYK21_02255 [Thermoplasmatales archaeon SG8-52-2]|nr:MAG: hypothetical protein AYK21_02255 [Thermoplasmatales archaeon SG8-52-2]
MIKKIIGFLICMLLLFPILSSSVTANQEPVLEIGKIRAIPLPFFRVFRCPIIVIRIKNIGNADAQNVTWSFGIKHPLIEILNITTGFNLTINKIKAGYTKIRTIGLDWIGRFEITVKARLPDGYQVSKTVKGFSTFRHTIIFPD